MASVDSYFLQPFKTHRKRLVPGQRVAPPSVGLARLSNRFGGHDFSHLKLDQILWSMTSPKPGFLDPDYGAGKRPLVETPDCPASGSP